MKTTLKAKMLAIFGLMVMLIISIGVIGLYGINASNNSLKTVYEDRTIALEQVSDIDRQLLRNRYLVLQALANPSPENMKKGADSIVADNVTIDKIWAQYVATYMTPQEKILADQFARDRTAYDKNFIEPVIKALRDGNADQVKELAQAADKDKDEINQTISALRKLQVDVAKFEYESASASYAVIRIIVILSVVLGTGIALTAGMLLIRNIYRQLGGEPAYAADVVRQIAGGDLAMEVRLNANDDSSLLSAMSGMKNTLANTVSNIRQSTDTIATASSQIAAGNMDLSSRTEQQASSLEETASSMEELTSTVQHNGDNARQANQLAVSASAVAQQSGRVVTQVVQTMGQIHESSKKIVDIISVIDGIAFQTNILALNAAVEAARAGEQGRGFAVVASEVRNLAQRAAGAANEIKALINDTVEKVNAGSILVNQAGGTMDEVVTSIKRVTDLMAEITAAGTEQENGIQQINQAVSEMDNVTQQNAALVEEAAAAASSLEDQALQLVELVSVFKLDAYHSAPVVPISAAAAKRAARNGHTPRPGTRNTRLAS
ncbi:methyl-accepting chemotaxis protein [Undibacterium sp. Di26W]|uniref:methyl-accepting chemotaxis protein n=1 Tax=Undibacterium sp. Di26W TaxID=3413035 RepID=UPI003BEF6ADA